MEPKKEEVEMHHQPPQIQDYSAVSKSPPPYTSQSNYPQAQPYGTPYQGSYPGPYQGPHQGLHQGPHQDPYADQRIFTVQPTVYVSNGGQASYSSDNLSYSIFTLLCCFCLPLTIPAVVCSCTTRDANLAGNREEAMRSSRTTFILNNVALGFGITTYIVLIVTLVLYGPWELD
ncbi:hypothetical protein NFI96_003011 [Prochilodus magdalenae]|nr:hypothetical protein NFI96_003011 [Prochilodus magdalenae]